MPFYRLGQHLQDADYAVHLVAGVAKFFIYAVEVLHYAAVKSAPPVGPPEQLGRQGFYLVEARGCP